MIKHVGIQLKTYLSCRVYTHAQHCKTKKQRSAKKYVGVCHKCFRKEHDRPQLIRLLSVITPWNRAPLLLQWSKHKTPFEDVYFAGSNRPIVLPLIQIDNAVINRAESLNGKGWQHYCIDIYGHSMGRARGVLYWFWNLLYLWTSRPTHLVLYLTAVVTILCTLL